MKFRPCIDIHNGQVKQIVGGTLTDKNNYAEENFVSRQNGSYYGRLYKRFGLYGGHIILLNPQDSEYYKADCEQAFGALREFEGGLQIGGGITAENAAGFLNKGASHVIVTSYVFKNGDVNFGNLNRLVESVGKSRLVLDLSCRRRGEDYYIVTDRWQKFTDTVLDERSIDLFSGYCSELLVHAVDAEGSVSGIEEDVAALLGKACRIPVTYAGGISGFDDLELLNRIGGGRIDFTVGSALDIFGGKMKFEDVAAFGSSAI
ncbi:phosphoribosylformimino-5-aminoimidazole carboxamide ribotide isomerase [Ruminococcus sp. Marseille-P6503]|uniref:phosphoribosylformimino-5-aminoimidazole carboxamide ribotide isomerase n=1 Tax=Ruminococcus sp. Marseille-P6503 TaxID=2364796 RepID=UPI000F5375E2|nr:phosphoribosylformimino-5-aminoimidazole carboxamide ribotide isomerase [Ruminococcus sp. Marseille-P6503]